MMDVDSLIATPMIWTPEMGQEEAEHEINRMLERSRVASEFLQGNLSLEDYLDCLNDHKIAVEDCVEDWLNGVSYVC